MSKQTELEKRLQVIERRQVLLFNAVKTLGYKALSHHWKRAADWVEKNQTPRPPRPARPQSDGLGPHSDAPIPEEKPVGWVDSEGEPLGRPRPEVVRGP